MSDELEILYEIGEPYAAGYLECRECDRFFRLCRAQRRFWERYPLPVYDGGGLFPCGKLRYIPMAMTPHYSYTYEIDGRLLRERLPEYADELLSEARLLPFPTTPHTVGGNGYTHSMPNYERVAREGLDSYAWRVDSMENESLREGLLDLLEGLRAYHRRCLEAVRGDERLTAALERVPWQPARTLYEALVCRVFIYYIDGCDNPGRLDAELFPYYNGEDITELLRAFFRSVDANDGWSSALGPDCNPVTVQCLRAIAGIRRPSIELRVTPETPDEVWEAARDALATSCGSPALYNEAAYQAALHAKFPYIPKEDLLRFNGGGCTETMLAGVSNVGSLDLGVNLARIFAPYLRERLAASRDFAEFVDGFVARVFAETAEALDQLNVFRRARAEVRPQPTRTLLIDDCVERGEEYTAGGARYYWGVVNFAGLVNVIDSLLAVRALVFERREYGAASFLALLDEGDAHFTAACRACPCFGVDDPNADSFAAHFTERCYAALEQRTPWPRGRFLASSIQFVTYTGAGSGVAATPDGRCAGEPLADSLGAVHGKDEKGPTALLASVSKLPQTQATGTPVLNLRLRRDYLMRYLRPLVEGYFAQGGMQLQISCVSREEMLDAVEHPERHANLIVRVGGYSEYFTRLTPELQKTVLERTEHC